MAESSAIRWTDSTFNPWVGCSKVSPGCAHCYAETWANRHADGAVWGDDGVRRRTAVSNWRKPLTWEKNHEAFEAEHGHRRRVFCASLADVFEPRPELESWRLELFDLIEVTPHLDWQLLTKRPDVARDTFRAGGWVLTENLWVGTSIENSRFTWRADVLREIPAAVRFISAEPLLGSLFKEGLSYRREPGDRNGVSAPLNLDGIDWLIVGGESGPRHREMNVEWVRELRDACECDLCGFERSEDCDFCSTRLYRSPAFFFKQWGGRTADAGGHVLDGREWSEMPGFTTDECLHSSPAPVSPAPKHGSAGQ